MVKLFEQDTLPVQAVIDYPESDGEPIGETDVHIRVILYLRSALPYLFRNEDQVYVAANMLFYFEQGDPSSFRSPDVFVVRGVQKKDRRTYKLWEEGAAPCLVVEVTSKKTWMEDLGNKKVLYERLGVQEYLLFDPLSEYLEPRFQAFRLERGRYREQRLEAGEIYRSTSLGIAFQATGTFLWAIDPETDRPVPSHLQAIEQADLEKRRADAETQRAQAEAQRAQAEAQRAEAEARRAHAVEEENFRLKAELEALQRLLGHGPS